MTQRRNDGIEIASYYFPNWHADPLNEAVHGKNWTEWELVKCARSRFAGHQQPKVPVWGYQDETDPNVMAVKIDAARRHGVDAFLFDWYYSEEGPFRERALREGFLRAPNLDDFRFAVLWCNHARQGLHPAPYVMNEFNVTTFSPAEVTPATFDRMTAHLVEAYFRHPNYWKIDGKPWFGVFNLGNLIRGFGGIRECALGMERFRAKAKAAGLPGIHFFCNFNGLREVVDRLEGRKPIEVGNPLQNDYGMTRRELADALGIDSCGPYGWWEHSFFSGFPYLNKAAILRNNVNHWKNHANEYGIDYLPTVMTGWDPSPRTVQSDMYEPRGYPWTGIYSLTPRELAAAFREAKEFLLTLPEGKRTLTVTAWNEWTEGSYLEPDDENGFACLEALRDVFGVAAPLNESNHQPEGK